MTTGGYDDYDVHSVENEPDWDLTQDNGKDWTSVWVNAERPLGQKLAWTWRNWTIENWYGGYRLAHGTEGYIALGDSAWTRFDTFADAAKIAEDREACAQ